MTPSARALELAREALPCWGPSACIDPAVSGVASECPACRNYYRVAQVIDRAVAERTEECAVVAANQFRKKCAKAIRSLAPLGET
jgi:predicted anti-sigma-YlaC factor YlaD